MELFHSSIRPYTSLHNFFPFKDCQTRFNLLLAIIVFTIFTLGIFYSKSIHSSKKYFENILHIFYKHFLECFFMFVEFRVFLIFPHFENNAFINIPILNMSFEILNQILNQLNLFILTLKVCSFSYVFFAIQSLSANTLITVKFENKNTYKTFFLFQILVQYHYKYSWYILDFLLGPQKYLCQVYFIISL